MWNKFELVEIDWGGLISDFLFILAHISHYPEHYPSKEKMLI